MREAASDPVAQIHTNSKNPPERGAGFLFFSGRSGASAGLCGILATAFLLGCALQGLALEPSTPLANYARQTWGMENGLPQNTVQALAQTRDGFVWLGTEVGLVRFDGNGFQVFDRNSAPALPGNDVRCLLQTRDGALWIGTSEGLARWKDGVVTAFTTKEGLPGGALNSVVEDSSGAVWAWTDQGLAHMVGEKFVPAAKGTPKGTITSIVAGDRDDIWVGTAEETGVFLKGQWVDQGFKCPFGSCLVGHGLGGQVNIAGGGVWDPILSGGAMVASGQDVPRGSLQLMEPFGHQGVAVASKSNLSLIEFGGGPASKLAVGHDLPGSRIQTLFKDSKGSLWIGTNSGLARWAGGRLELLPVTDPLATASILALMEDHEGNLWVGTETDGLHILRDQRFRTLGTREGLSSDATTAVVEDKTGTLWVGTNGSGLNAMHPESKATLKTYPSHKNVTRVERPDSWEAVKTYSVRDGLLSDVILSWPPRPTATFGWERRMG